MKKKVLLIEDDVWLAELYQNAIEEGGKNEVSLAISAELALAKLDEKKPNIIVLDLFLPDHNGVELLHEIASYEDLAEIPVIILSTVPEREFILSKNRWRHYGVVEYLYKPEAKPEKVANSVARQLVLASNRVAS